MAGFVVREGQIFLIFRFQEDVVINPFGREERCSEVIVSADDPNLEILVL